MKKSTAVSKVKHPTPIIRTTIEQTFSGPLPPPNILVNYEQACPGAADRIIRLAEQQAGHRQNTEIRALRAELINERKAINYSFVLSLILMIAGAVLIFENKNTAGLFALFGPSIFQAGSFIAVQSRAKRKRQETESNE